MDLKMASKVVKEKWIAVWGVIRRPVRILATMLIGVVIALLVVAVLFLNNQPDLSVWHTVELDEEFTADSPVTNFEDYLALEDRLFAQLNDTVYAGIRPEEKDRINRYNRGSLSDPARWPRDWNRSFERSPPRPRAGVLLIHGMSDSPYSLRNLGERLAASGARVLGLRVPGHGTAPSGLVHVEWEDMAAAVTLAVRHLRKKTGDRPLYIIGYSNGGALAMHYILSALEDDALPGVNGVVLISPQIGVTRLAALAVWQARLGSLLGLPKLSWTSVLPEYDPFKYGSFAVKAGEQAHRLTTDIRKRITKLGPTGALTRLPPILSFQSAVDSTVLAPALIQGLFERLPRGEHELVLFDINQYARIESLLDFSPRDLIKSLLQGRDLTYRLTVVTNENPSSRKVIVKEAGSEGGRKSVVPLCLKWPRDVYSLSHVALPFPPHDPLYGGDRARPSPGIQLGNVALRGEHGRLRVRAADLLRLRWNPFYDYMELRVLQFMELGGSVQALCR